MKALRTLLPLLLAGWMTGSLAATERVDLYYAERIIAQSADEARQIEVVADALQEVLRRSSGLSELPGHEAIERAKARPIDLLSRFSLGDSDETIPDAIGNPQPTYNLELTFEPSLVRDILTDAGIPVWTDKRPRSLVLLAAPEGGRIDLQGEHSEALAVAELGKRAASFGLPLHWPLLDLEDISVVTADDVWGGFTEELLAVGERYNADAILAGYIGIQPDTGNWVGRWHFILGGQRHSATFFGDDQAAVVQEGVALASRIMSERYGVRLDNEPQAHEFSVLNMGSMDAHVAVRRYLREIIGTEALYMDSLNGSTARYRLYSAAEQSRWLDLLALDGRLQEVSTITLPGEEPRLEFIWRD
ncbi:MAG: DUF2066 domain-containing protein [Natronospirillum sp.]|uniref:DUF2066 domain-containing protein n=1 Tax=Natronospirillum sp. TaxID=2812955 RepID=UPI0025F6A1FF|nr:DUF2066 domain-containing protein [Natronospirillum sp.]MCH8552835.1 DUF2066 domain-containing protein [Natronospirillum sp.]